MHVCVRTHILMEMVYFAVQARRCPPSAVPSVTVILLYNVRKTEEEMRLLWVKQGVSEHVYEQGSGQTGTVAGTE